MKLENSITLKVFYDLHKPCYFDGTVHFKVLLILVVCKQNGRNLERFKNEIR